MGESLAPPESQPSFIQVWSPGRTRRLLVIDGRDWFEENVSEKGWPLFVTQNSMTLGIGVASLGEVGVLVHEQDLEIRGVATSTASKPGQPDVIRP